MDKGTTLQTTTEQKLNTRADTRGLTVAMATCLRYLFIHSEGWNLPCYLSLVSQYTVTQIYFYMSVFNTLTFGSFSEETKSLCTFVSLAAGSKLEQSRNSILAASVCELMSN